MNLQKGIVLLAGTTLLTAAALAQTKEKAPQTSSQKPAASHVMPFKDIDKNSDGYINRTEANASTGLSSMFSDLDADKDGRLTASEYAKREDHK